ncbi:MAG TPA: plasmid pRiA4b ORF-3 family protein [Anaerolineae bacterium]|nr:plasmid pRiA4b ORF-3 family protein [Anaerolineae bacterium]
MSEQIYRLKITLRDSKPPIWRRVLVPGSTTLSDLHWIIQAVMGWYNAHLHQFIIGPAYYSDPQFELDALDESQVRLEEIAEEGTKFTYEYDFGDDWEHIILVEKVQPPEPGVEYPVCIKGRRACPPEDVGGMWGYYEFLEAIGDPNHPEHEEYLEWIGEDFDPAAFSLEETNARLREWLEE